MAQTDNDLIEQFLRGNFAAFEQLVYRYDRQVLSIAARYTQSSDDAKDIYQEVFIRVYKGLSKFELRSEFSTWLFRIATNVCLSFAAKEKKRAVTSLHDDENEENTAVSEERADSQTHNAEISERIEHALKNLSPQQKMVFTLRHYEQYKIKEIAEMMNCAEGTIKKYLFEAAQKLRTRLHDIYE